MSVQVLKDAVCIEDEEKKMQLAGKMIVKTKTATYIIGRINGDGSRPIKKENGDLPFDAGKITSLAAGERMWIDYLRAGAVEKWHTSVVESIKPG